MTPWEVLARLRASRIEVRLDGERIRLRAPVGAITEELRRAVQLHKASLVRLLAGSAPATHGERAAHLLVLLQAHCARHIWTVAALQASDLDERTDRAWDTVAHEARRFVSGAESTDARLRAALARHDALTPAAAPVRRRFASEGAS